MAYHVTSVTVLACAVISSPPPGGSQFFGGFLMRQAIRSVCLGVCLLQWMSAAVTVAVFPTGVAMRPGATKTFGTSVRGTTNSSVIWKVNGVAGGNATVGTITKDGVYTAPAKTPSPSLVTLAAVSVADPKVSGTVSVQIQNPVPSITSFDPVSVNTGSFAVTVRGTNFLNTSKVTVDGVSVPAVFVSATELRIIGATSKQGTSIPIVVTNPDPGSASGSKSIPVMATVAVSVAPTTITLRTGAKTTFKAAVRNSTNTEVTWQVNNVAGGNATVGTIDASGNYTAPLLMPTPATVNVQAKSKQNTSSIGTAAVTIQNAFPVISLITPGTTLPGAVTLKITGTGFAKDAQLLIAGRAVKATVSSSTLITATTTVAATVGGVLAVQVSNPNPGGSISPSAILRVGVTNPKMGYTDAVAFLERATWGPTPESILRLQTIGYEAFLQEQFAAPASIFGDRPATESSFVPIQRQFFVNALTQPDQLRQRMAFALSQLLVTSGARLNSVQKFLPYFQILQENALGNYRDILQAITLNPGMGEYLDMVNNAKATGSIVPNENYARELLQLFSLGVFQLNRDGSVVRDSSGNPAPTYSEDTVKNFARVFTGWTYPSKPGAVVKWKNPIYYASPMEPVEAYHDNSSKALLNGTILPGGYTAQEDVKAALDNIFSHPNIAPFVAERLIKNFTTSNPDPGYIEKVARVFENNGSGVRGDLKAVIRTILLEGSRTGSLDSSTSSGQRLRDPVLFQTTAMRAMGIAPTPDHLMANQAEQMGMKVFFSPSVFSYYSPLYEIPGSTLTGPEFAIFSPATAITRINFAWTFATNGVTGATFDNSEWLAIADPPENLVERLSTTFFRGDIPNTVKGSILNALYSTTDKAERVRIGLYLAIGSPQFQVQQ